MPLGMRIVNGDSRGLRLSRKLMRIPGIIHCLGYDSSTDTCWYLAHKSVDLIANLGYGSVY